MCLLIVSPKNAPEFTEEWIDDFISYNGDGIGVMYAEDGKVQVHKLLPTSSEQAYKFVAEHSHGRECAIHFRMATHGDHDLTNCHPYEVFSDDEGGAMWMMHNGILHTGNALDTRYSDTWHFIQDYIRPMLKRDRELLFTPAFQTMLSSFISTSNKLTFVNFDGRMVTINRHAGVKWAGRWLSNEYAWSAPSLYIKPTEVVTEEEVAALQMKQAPEYRSYKSGHPNQGYGRGFYTPSSLSKKYSAVHVGSGQSPSGLTGAANEIEEYIGEVGFASLLDVFNRDDLLQFLAATGEDFAWYLVDQLDSGHISQQHFVDYILNPEDAVADEDPDLQIVSGYLADEDHEDFSEFIQVGSSDDDDLAVDLDEQANIAAAIAGVASMMDQQR